MDPSFDGQQDHSESLTVIAKTSPRMVNRCVEYGDLVSTRNTNSIPRNALNHSLSGIKSNFLQNNI